LRSAALARPSVMRLTCTVLALAATAACRQPTYLPATTLRQLAPRCGAHPVAPRPGDRGPTYFSCQVNRPSEPPADRPLDYPVLLADAGVGSEVLLQFVIDERGRVDSTTIKTVASGHDLFLRAAEESLLTWPARPAERRGRPVRQLTTHLFCFRAPAQGALAYCAERLTRSGASSMSVACTDGGSTVARSHGGIVHLPARRPPNVRCN
jgi:hypothetical protein